MTVFNVQIAGIHQPHLAHLELFYEQHIVDGIDFEKYLQVGGLWQFKSPSGQHTIRAAGKAPSSIQNLHRKDHLSQGETERKVENKIVFFILWETWCAGQ